MTPSKTTTPITSDKTTKTATKLCGLKKQLHHLAASMASEPRLAKAESKVMSALTDIQIALDEIEASKEQA